MGGWMLAGIRRGPGPLIGTVAASAAAAVLTVAAISTAAAHTQAPAGRLASASVVVAGSTNVSVTHGSGEDAEHETLPLSAYRGVPASLAQRLAQVVPFLLGTRRRSGASPLRRSGFAVRDAETQFGPAGRGFSGCGGGSSSGTGPFPMTRRWSPGCPR